MRRFLLTALLVPAFLFSAPQPARTPSWWEVSLSLSTEGRYRVEEGGVVYSGRYHFVLLWIGLMEREEDDYCLFHYSTNLQEWEAEEKTSDPGRVPLRTESFPSPPDLQFHFILTEHDDLHLEFTVQGFPVPQNPSRNKTYLVLPSSEKSGPASEGSPEESEGKKTAGGKELSYDAFIEKGSNRIHVKEYEIYSGPVERSFSWRWSRQSVHKKSGETLFLFHTHDVRVRASFSPRYT